MSVGGVSAANTTSEDLFNHGQYDEFLRQASTEAKTGDAEAVFLLGKAHHLGKGIEKNLDLALALYQQAREKGSARASHNLGLLALDDGRSEEAIPLLQEALDRGLKLPTLYNLGRAHTPPDPHTWFDLPGVIPRARRAGDYFAQAHTLRPDAEFDVAAARQYLRAYLMALNVLPGARDQFDLAVLREQAIEWMQKGMDRNHGPSWTNYGAMLLDEKKYTEARAALLKGAEQKVAIAHYHLARMEEAGWAQEKRDRERAVFHYETATLLGLEQARHPAQKLLEEQLQYETDLGKLEQGIARLRALRKPDDLEMKTIYSPSSRLAWGLFLREQQQNFRPLPNLPIILRACGLGLNEPYGLDYNIGENSQWRLEAHVGLRETQPLPIQGLVDARGCAVFTGKMPAQVRKVLSEGAVLTLRFPNYSLPMEWTQSGKRVVLRLRPLGTPLPSD